MSLILRFDVDLAYSRDFRPLGFGLDFIRTKLNLFYPLKSKKLGYMRNVERLVNYLQNKNAKATLFFRPCTLPERDLAADIINSEIEAGYHAEETQNYEKFVKGLKKVSNRFKGEIYGFAKHGTWGKMSRVHDGKYEPWEYINYGKKAGLKYFTGNYYKREKFEKEEKWINGFLYLPTVLLFRSNFDMNWLVEETENKDVVMLIHPTNLYDKPSFISKTLGRKVNLLPKLDEIIDRVSETETLRELAEKRLKNY